MDATILKFTAAAGLGAEKGQTEKLVRRVLQKGSNEVSVPPFEYRSLINIPGFL